MIQRTHRQIQTLAKLGLAFGSWHQAQFFPLVLHRRIPNTALSVPRKETAPGAQVRALAAKGKKGYL